MCSEDALSEEFTQLGLCYTFNSDRVSPLYSDQPGRGNHLVVKENQANISLIKKKVFIFLF